MVETDTGKLRGSRSTGSHAGLFRQALQAPFRSLQSGGTARTRTGAVPHARAGRWATWTAHGDYLLVLSST
eukprot:6501376-Prymnesium_polylepis.1